MDDSTIQRSSSSLFQVYLRLRPSHPASVGPAAQLESPANDRFLAVEEPDIDGKHGHPTHITVIPPTDSRRRAVEKFAFTRVFEEEATQLDVFDGTDVVSLIEGVLAPDGRHGRDGLVATLGVTGSGKSHTMLGSPSQRGLTQLALDVLYRSLDGQILDPNVAASLVPVLAASEASEANIIPAATFLEGPKREGSVDRGTSRAQTPMRSGREPSMHMTSVGLYPALLGQAMGYSSPRQYLQTQGTNISNPVRLTRSAVKPNAATSKNTGAATSAYHRQALHRLSMLPQIPAIDHITVPVDQKADYAVLVSMYEVYNDRIFDLLAGSESTQGAANNAKNLRRRPLLFKSTELSPDRKVVAGLRKIVCANLEEALMVLEAGLIERRVAGTGSNSISSRSHGFFCLEVQKRPKRSPDHWLKTSLTIVDLAGSERARNAKTAGATLAEAGKINESLMYLGQCLQMQSDRHEGNKAAIVPFRQCKLTELLFSNSFPTTFSTTHQQAPSHSNAQKAIMIVTADPLGDFNATSQILRYSALAREVTVPRVPSVASTIFSGTTRGGNLTSGRTSPTITVDEAIFAAQEIARLSDEVEAANMRLMEEQNRRHEAELALEAAQERCVVVEQEIREEIFAEAEARLEEERERWKWAWYEEADRNDEHMDKKLEVLSRTIQIYEDPDTSIIKRLEQLEEENAALRRQLNQAEQYVQSASPTKKKSTKQSSTGASPTKALPANEDLSFESTMTQRQERTLRELSLTSQEYLSRSPTKPKRNPSKQQSIGATSTKASLTDDDDDSNVENTMLSTLDTTLPEISFGSPTKTKKRVSKQSSAGANTSIAFSAGGGNDSDIENTMMSAVDMTFQEPSFTNQADEEEEELDSGSPTPKTRNRKPSKQQASIRGDPTKALRTVDHSEIENTMMKTLDSTLQELSLTSHAEEDELEEEELELQDEPPSPKNKKKKNAKQQSVRGSPIKVKALLVGTDGDDSQVEKTKMDTLDTALQELPLSTPLKPKTPAKTPAKTPGRKLRKLTTRKWDLAPEDSLGSEY